MPRTNGRLISEADQLKYNKSAISALGLREDNELMKWAQKADGGVSGTDLKTVVFYQMLKDTNSVQTVASAKFASVGVDFDATSGTFNMVAGTNGSEILRGILATPSTLTSTIYRGEREYSKTMLNTDSNIVEYQKSDINEKLELAFLNKLSTLNAGTLTMKTQGGDLTNVGIPTANVFGDNTKVFETDTNLMEFRRMVARAKIVAGSKRQVFFVGGENFVVLTEVATRFANNNWADIATKKGGIKNAQEILSASKMVLETPVIILRDFDTIFPLGTGSETEVFLITQNAYGFDKSQGTGKVIELPERRSVMFDMVVDYVLEVTDPIGFYKFKFKYGMPA